MLSTLSRSLSSLILCGSLAGVVAHAGLTPVGVSELEGRNAKPLLERPVASIRVYAFQKGEPVMIPFQVDERDRRDHWADDQGEQPVRDDSPGIVDKNDVVAFMNRDLGAKGDAKRLPGGAAVWIEVRVGAKDAPIGYAYVGAFSTPPPLPEGLADYSRYDPVKDEVFADRYFVRFGGPLPSYLGIVRRQGERGDNVLNAVRAHGEARILAGLFHLERGEKDLQYTIQGSRDGPVRAIRSAKYWIPLPLGFKARGRGELLFYRDFVEGRAHINVKIPPRLVPADGEITAYFDFHDFAGARVLGPGGVVDEPIDGRMSDQKRILNRQPVRWSALLLPNGQTFLLAIRLAGSLQRLDQDLYLDDSSDPARGKPSFGFRLAGVNRLDTGQQDISVNAMILDSTSQSEIAAAANMILDTPEVVATEINAPAATAKP